MTLGEYLRQEREKRGITIEQVASATKIGVRLLHSLEGDQFSELPAKPFIRGFVTSYARFIGLNPSEILEQYASFIDEKAQERPARDSGHSGYAFEKREGESTKVALWIILGTFALFGGIAVIFLKGPKHHRGSHADKLRAAHSPVATLSPSPVPTGSVELAAPVIPVPAPTSAPVVESSPSPTPAPSPSPSPASSPTPTPGVSPTGKPDLLNSGINLKPSEIKHKLIFKALEDVRIRYQVDDRPITGFIFKKDKILVLRATARVIFQTNRPGAVSFNYNGSGNVLVEKARNLVMRQNVATLIYPREVIESIQDPFPGQGPLSGS